MLEYPIGSSGQVLVLPAEVVRKFRRYRQTRWYQREAGGQLFARLSLSRIVIEEANRLRMAARASVTGTERELRRVQSEIAKLVQALKDGVPASIVKDPLIALEKQQTELRVRLERSAQPPLLLHPNMADLYRQKVIQLAKGLEFEESRIGAAEALRGLIDAIVLTPEEGTLKIELQGNLAAMLKAAQAQNSNNRKLAPLGRWEDERSPDTDDLVQIMLVAGARNHLNLEFQWAAA